VGHGGTTQVAGGSGGEEEGQKDLKEKIRNVRLSQQCVEIIGLGLGTVYSVP
jgi:hypothetical protein